jgi:hypothetical protein
MGRIHKGVKKVNKLKKEWREMFLNITLIESLVASQKS